ncbi:hypothetical protein Ddye_027090 [Dipteronia dyeriana]|uniref:Protein kinase domain-containing protein n=1 Tax=Dipteronia dyeriana TaxID=168575 RepID=A0AAD9TPD7_9ROSI|nr:hypothetical protein Ddye_027090 [Dipteronia dyeriana]
MFESFINILGPESRKEEAKVPLIDLGTIAAATNNFLQENMIGKGGFCPVYTGKLRNGREVAAKRLSRRSGQGLEELKNETMLMAKLQLRNLVWELWNNDRAMDLMDPIAENEALFPMLIRYISVTLQCVQEIAADRPTMSEVVSMLTNEHIVLTSPKQPAFSCEKSAKSNST